MKIQTSSCTTLLTATLSAKAFSPEELAKDLKDLNLYVDPLLMQQSLGLYSASLLGRSSPSEAFFLQQTACMIRLGLQHPKHHKAEPLLENSMRRKSSHHFTRKEVKWWKEGLAERLLKCIQYGHIQILFCWENSAGRVTRTSNQFLPKVILKSIQWKPKA